MAGLNDLISSSMDRIGMPQGAPVPGGNIPLQGQVPRGIPVSPEMEAKFAQALQGDAGAMANFIMMVIGSAGQ